MGAPTNNDYESFRNESEQNKIDVLYEYICLGNGNMQEIAAKIYYNDNQASRRVSVITRCYGFEGNNKGRFKKIGATRDDVAAFVRAFPDGAYYDGKGSEMEEFLRNRVEARGGMDNTASDVFWDDSFVSSMPQRTPNARKKSLVPSMRQQTPNRSNWGGTGSDNQLGQDVNAISVVLVIVAILLIVFRKKIFAFIMEILPFVMTIGLAILVFKALLNGGFHINKQPSAGRKPAGKRNAGRSSGGLNLTGPNLLGAGIFLYIGIGGFMNGGNIIIALIFCAMGVGVLKT